MSNTAAACLSVAVMRLAAPMGRWSIDADDIEDRIVTGATRTLAHPRLRSVLIEMDWHDAGQTAAIERVLGAAGLTAGERHTLADPRFHDPVFQGP